MQFISSAIQQSVSLLIFWRCFEHSPAKWILVSVQRCATIDHCEYNNVLFAFERSEDEFNYLFGKYYSFVCSEH